MPLNCTRCGEPIGDSTFIGDGDGSGQRFAHADCYREGPFVVEAHKAMAHNDRVRDFVLETVARLREQDFVFSVEAHGEPWDVYRFVRSGRRGMLAVRLVGDTPERHAEIGFYRAGEFTEEQVRTFLLEDAPS